jgi:glycosyltransferase involved in cell wall biosynthesis
MQVIGIMLVHNEDRFLRRAVENAVDFCDRILIANHRSTDGTTEIAEALAREHAKVEHHQVRDARESNTMLQSFAGTDTWVFGIDGDELYDREGLRWTRAQLEAGAWKEWWAVFGNVLNCTDIDAEKGTATGYLAPPCRSMTKLYNFSAVEALDPDAPQRFMGRNDRFKPGFDAERRLDLYKDVSWEAARFRCLHACFMPRSSAQPVAAGGRANLTDLARRPWWQRLLRMKASPRHKMEKYQRGPLVTVDATPFLC